MNDWMAQKPLRRSELMTPASCLSLSWEGEPRAGLGTRDHPMPCLAWEMGPKSNDKCVWGRERTQDRPREEVCGDEAETELTLQGSRPCRHFHFDPVASRTVRKYIPVFFSHRACGR